MESFTDSEVTSARYPWLSDALARNRTKRHLRVPPIGGLVASQGGEEGTERDGSG